MLGVRELFRVARHDSVAKWEIVTLVGCGQLANCHLHGLETDAFLESCVRPLASMLY